MLLGDREDRKYVRVPKEARRLAGFRLSDAEWDALGIPIGLAFFFESTPEGRVLALYPGPAGPTESLLPLDAWAGIAARNPALAELEPDVEALLVNRVNGAHGILRRADRPLLRAGRADPHPLAGHLGRRRCVAGDRRLLRRACAGPRTAPSAAHG